MSLDTYGLGINVLFNASIDTLGLRTLRGNKIYVFSIKKEKIPHLSKPFREFHIQSLSSKFPLILIITSSSCSFCSSLNVSSYPRCHSLTSIKILGLTVFVFCQRQQQMMTTLCPLGIDLKFSTATCHSPPLSVFPLLVAGCGSRRAARHAVWQDEKISHSLKSSAAATLQSLRNVPSLQTFPRWHFLCPFSISFPTSMCMSMAGAGQLVSILVFSFEFGFRLQFGASTSTSFSYSLPLFIRCFSRFLCCNFFSPFGGFPFWQLAEQTER